MSFFKGAIDLFDNGVLLIYSFICMIINFTELVSMCKIQENSYFQTRSERLIIIHIKEYINRPPLWKRSTWWWWWWCHAICYLFDKPKPISAFYIKKILKLMVQCCLIINYLFRHRNLFLSFVAKYVDWKLKKLGQRFKVWMICLQ